ncbi:unnamed protein product [Brassica napus]|uniref:(rape) hypothetical protein n=1 Tax=Brassica napus TaxID=3708 RepID=A0A816UR64_BRANA|nr:unnamed protein product [Brassica napus]
MSINEKTSSTNIFISFFSNLLSIEDMSKFHTSNLLQLQAIQRLGVRSTNGRFQSRAMEELSG